MSEISDLNETDSSNTSISGYSTDGSVANMATVDNVFQSILGMLKRWFRADRFRLRDSADQTKLLAFNLANFTTATTRTLTPPNASATIAGLEVAQTFTARQTVQRGSGSTASPNANAAAVIDSDNLTLLNLLSPNNNTCAIYLGDPDNPAVGRVQYANTTDELQFYANNAEVGRFFSTGEFGVGRTFTSAGANDAGVLMTAAGGIISARTGTGANTHMTIVNNSAVAAATVGSITSNGSATAYNTTSDQDLKENFEEFQSGPLLDAISVYKFDWKIGGSGYGVKAQECYGVFPDAITPGHGAPGDDDYMPWSADYSKLVPLLVREVQSLRLRLAALES